MKDIANVGFPEIEVTPKTADGAVEFLAARLYWKMNQLDPVIETIPNWKNLRERDKRFYRSCIADLLAFKDIVNLIQ